jgi:hypothetical protein
MCGLYCNSVTVSTGTQGLGHRSYTRCAHPTPVMCSSEGTVHSPSLTADISDLRPILFSICGRLYFKIINLHSVVIKEIFRKFLSNSIIGS